MNPRDALNQIRRWIGERVATSYTRNGCRVSLANLPRERVVLDVDLAFPTDRAVKAQCDFILFYTRQDTLVAVPMELKQGDVDASEVVKQLQEGAHVVNRLVPRNVKTDCIPCPYPWQQEGSKQTKRETETFFGEFPRREVADSDNAMQL